MILAKRPRSDAMEVAKVGQVEIDTINILKYIEVRFYKKLYWNVASIFQNQAYFKENLPPRFQTCMSPDNPIFLRRHLVR